MSTDESVVAAELRRALVGEVITPADPTYEQARRVWNGAIDRHPAVIARCAGTADVVEAIGVARRHPIELSIRGGGHQIAGSGVCDGGLVIDLSAMNGVHVDADARTARVAGGARWADVDRATQLFGLATTGGEVSMTGVAGLTLGGGLGLLQRAFGLACDNLRSIEIVTADGLVRTASAEQHVDLFWAARGAGRGLGVVTSFEFQLRPLGPEVATAFFLYDASEARRIARAWRDAALDCPEAVSPELLFMSVPADDLIPTELHGRPVIATAMVFAGDPADAAPALEPFASLGEMLVDLGGVMPYADLQCSADGLFPDGDRYYFKSHFADGLDDAALDAIVAAGAALPNPESLIGVRTLGGAIDRVSPEASAYPHRGARFNVSFDARWSSPLDDARTVGWARAAWTAFRPFGTGGVYINFAGFEDEPDVKPSDTLGSQARLAEIRNAYDPNGLFAGAAHRP